MASFNKVMILGNVGKEPRVAKFDDGGMIAEVCVATTEKGFTTKSGRKIEDKTTWHDVKFVGNVCKVVEQYVKVGTRIFVSGRLEKRKYTDKQGIERTVCEIMSDELVLVGSASDDANKTQQSAKQEEAAPFGQMKQEELPPMAQQLVSAFDCAKQGELPF